MSDYYAALKAEWANLSGATDEKLAAINALKVSGPDQTVAIADVMGYLRSNGLWLRIKEVAKDNPIGAAAAAVDIAGDLRAQTIDFNLPLVQGFVQQLVSDGLLPQDAAAALDGMKKTTVPWATENGYSFPVSMSDVTNAKLS